MLKRGEYRLLFSKLTTCHHIIVACHHVYMAKSNGDSRWNMDMLDLLPVKKLGRHLNCQVCSGHLYLSLILLDSRWRYLLMQNFRHNRRAKHHFALLLHVRVYTIRQPIKRLLLQELMYNRVSRLIAGTITHKKEKPLWRLRKLPRKSTSITLSMFPPTSTKTRCVSFLKSMARSSPIHAESNHLEFSSNCEDSSLCTGYQRRLTGLPTLTLIVLMLLTPFERSPRDLGPAWTWLPL